MSETTKAKINLKEGLIELEGSEDFVGNYLNLFKDLLMVRDFDPKQQEVESEPPLSKDEPKGAPQPKKKAPAKKAASSKRTAPKVEVERFDIHGKDDTPSLKTFMEEKKPGTKNGNIIVVIGYYITEILGDDFFTLGQVEYAYKMLGLKRPGHMRQIMINEKNERDLYEPDEEDKNKWNLTRSGELFVSDQLPVAES